MTHHHAGIGRCGTNGQTLGFVLVSYLLIATGSALLAGLSYFVVGLSQADSAAIGVIAAVVASGACFRPWE